MLTASELVPGNPPWRRRGLFRSEYDHLVALGVFEGQKLELLEGELIEMSPSHEPHAYAIRILIRLLPAALLGRADVLIQLPFALSDRSEPEPDVALIDPAASGTEHPSSAFLLIEVAESSLGYDRGPKLRAYAAARVPEYWVVSTERRCVYVYRGPDGEDYTSQATATVTDLVSPLAFPDVVIPVRALFAG